MRNRDYILACKDCSVLLGCMTGEPLECKSCIKKDKPECSKNIKDIDTMRCSTCFECYKRRYT